MKSPFGKISQTWVSVRTLSFRECISRVLVGNMPSRTKIIPPVWPKLLDRGCFAGIPRKVGRGGCLEIALLHVLHFISSEEGEIVITLFHWAYSCNYTSQKKRKELRERQIEKVCTYFEWSSSTSLECFLMFMILNRKDFQSFHLWRPWSMTSLFDR